MADPAPLLTTSKLQAVNSVSVQMPTSRARWMNGIFPASPQFDSFRSEWVKDYKGMLGSRACVLVTYVTKSRRPRAGAT
jgi:hypothetical protein